MEKIENYKSCQVAAEWWGKEMKKGYLKHLKVCAKASPYMISYVQKYIGDGDIEVFQENLAERLDYQLQDDIEIIVDSIYGFRGDLVEAMETAGIQNRDLFPSGIMMNVSREEVNVKNIYDGSHKVIYKEKEKIKE